MFVQKTIECRLNFLLMFLDALAFDGKRGPGQYSANLVALDGIKLASGTCNGKSEISASICIHLSETKKEGGN